jgi:hypothetical protein
MNSISISIRWTIRTLSGAVLAKCETHAEAVQRIEHCQSEADAGSAWLADLRICRTEVAL